MWIGGKCKLVNWNSLHIVNMRLHILLGSTHHTVIPAPLLTMACILYKLSHLLIYCDSDMDLLAFWQ